MNLEGKKRENADIADIRTLGKKNSKKCGFKLGMMKARQ
jgi:hypothetical protein